MSVIHTVIGGKQTIFWVSTEWYLFSSYSPAIGGSKFHFPEWIDELLDKDDIV